MKLPGAERAIVDMAKLRDYCLNEQHPRGRHKARVFSLTLGITLADAAVLREALLDAAIEGEAVATERDDYGQRYVVGFEMTDPGGRATVRSTWIVLRQEDFTRMTSCYVL